MGLIARLRHKIGYVWYWRVRHWWYDKPGGRVARIAGALLLAVVLTAATIVAGIEAFRPQPAGQPHQAIVWMVVWLIVALVVGLALALTMKQPKPQTPDNTQTPTTEDGQSAKHFFGTCWGDDSFLLAWKVTGREPIKTKGGKK